MKREDRRIPILNVIRTNPEISLEAANRVFANRNWSDRLDEYELSMLKEFAQRQGELEELLEGYDTSVADRLYRVELRIFGNPALAIGGGLMTLPALWGIKNAVDVFGDYFSGILLYAVAISFWGFLYFPLVVKLLGCCILPLSERYFREEFFEDAHLALLFQSLYYDRKSQGVLDRVANWLEVMCESFWPSRLIVAKKERLPILTRKEYYQNDLRLKVLSKIRNNPDYDKEALNQELKSQNIPHQILESEWNALVQLANRSRNIITELEECGLHFSTTVTKSWKAGFDQIFGQVLMCAIFPLIMVTEVGYMQLVKFDSENYLHGIALIARFLFWVGVFVWGVLLLIRSYYLTNLYERLGKDAPLFHAFWKMHVEPQLKYSPINHWRMSPNLPTEDV